MRVKLCIALILPISLFPFTAPTLLQSAIFKASTALAIAASLESVTEALGIERAAGFATIGISHQGFSTTSRPQQAFPLFFEILDHVFNRVQ